MVGKEVFPNIWKKSTLHWALPSYKTTTHEVAKELSSVQTAQWDFQYKENTE